MAIIYNPGSSTPAIKRIEYAVTTTGDVWFNPTIGTSDSPNYSDTTDKAAALTQCFALSHLGK